MDIRALVDMMSEKEMYKRVATGQNMSLGGLIEALDDIPDKAATVYVQGGSQVGRLDSYRGYYSDLSLVPGNELSSIEKLLAALKLALGETFEGYKGGSFVMESHAPLWYSEYGCSSGIAIKGVAVVAGEAMLLTELVD